jgi:hypothetical protein
MVADFRFQIVFELLIGKQKFIENKSQEQELQ